MYVYMYLDHKYIAVSYIMYLYMYLDHKYIAIIILLYVNTTLAPNVVSHCAMLQLYLASVYSTIGKVCTLYNNPYNQVGPGTLCIHLCKKKKNNQCFKICWSHNILCVNTKWNEWKCQPTPYHLWIVYNFSTTNFD